MTPRSDDTDLIYPEDASCGIRVEGVRDQRGALVDGAAVFVTVCTLDGVPLDGAEDMRALAVAGELGTYEWIAPEDLGLRGRYLLHVRATRGKHTTPAVRTLRTAPYEGEDVAWAREHGRHYSTY